MHSSHLAQGNAPVKQPVAVVLSFTSRGGLQRGL
jgi:hypothetical protein